MLEVIEFLLLPIIACIVSVLLFGYFGLHVLKRGVIFVDISLAQVAALGTIVGMAAGISTQSWLLKLSALAAVTLAAALFSKVKLESRGIPQEALIGIVYCLSLSLCLFLAEFVPEGSGFIKESLTGALLWVTWGKIGVLTTIGIGAGLFHFIFRDKFMQTSQTEAGAKDVGRALWDFLFYFTLGVVITEAVEILGIFLVFTLLVVPASVSILLFTGWLQRLLAAWIVGGVASVTGILVAYQWNLPNSPTIVTVLGLTLIGATLIGLLLPQCSNRIPFTANLNDKATTK
jgi:zinc/manganese transport system permease protein